MSDNIKLVNLRENPSQELLAGFIDVYNRTFTDPSERENPEEWPGRMWQTPVEPQPPTHLLLALSELESGTRVVGGLVFEHYTKSHCGLLTYLVVEPDWRKQGIAKKMVDRAIRTLIRQEEESGGELRAVFCETADPRLVSDAHTAMPACERMHAILGLGARVLNVDYVQPPLTAGANSCDHLLLLAFDPRHYPRKKTERPITPNLTKQILLDFLREFYCGLGIDNPDTDPHFDKIIKSIPGELTLADPRENPVLSMAEVAVCLHFVSNCPVPPEKTLPYPNCPVFQSMELDLLSYGYQSQNQIGSQCESSGSAAVEIRFPEYVEYHSEGRHMLLLPRRGSCRVRVIVSSTHFLVSGVRVWHVVLTPDEGEIFSEYDVIKLIHLYDGRAENTGLADKIQFRVQSKNGIREAKVHKLLGTLLNQDGQELYPKAGTIQIVGEGVGRNESYLGEILESVRTDRTSTEQQEEQKKKKISEWISRDTEQGKVMKALCGIVTGIFDFAEVDNEEVLDTLEPTCSGPGSLIRIHRGTLVSITAEDRAMAEVRNSIGISPYLLLPHAVLLHNETLIEDSDAGMTEAVSKKRPNLKKLEDAVLRAERNLNRFYLPNVFNYFTERALFDRGTEGRGTGERLNAVRNKLLELDTKITAEWEQRHHRGQKRIAALMALFTVIGSKEILTDITEMVVQPPIPEWYVWAELGFLTTLVVSLYFIWGVKRFR